jgi:hypothetical protein
MKWKAITIRQFQELAQIEKSAGDDFDIKVAKVAHLEGKTLADMDQLSIGQLNDLFRKYADLFNEVAPDKTMREWYKDGVKYKLISDIRDINAGQYNELIHFSKGGDIVGNLHRLMATLVMPMERKYFRWVPMKKDHAKVSELMLDAPFHLCLKSAVFFCKVYTASLKNLTPFLAEQLMKEGMTRLEALEAMEGLCSLMDGILMPSKLPTSKT